MQAVTERQRNPYWDNLKGLLIWLVVFAHILYAWKDQYAMVNIVVSVIYMFHMPAFVFISGYFGKSEKSRSFQSLLKLALLYFIFNSAMGFIYGFYDILHPMYSYWYLLALIFWRLTAHRIAKWKWIVWILMGVSLIAGFYSEINNTLAIARIIGMYPYYMVGYLLSEEKSNALVENKHRIWFGIAGIIGGLLLSFVGYFCFRYAEQELIYDVYRDPIGLFGRMLLYGIAFLAIFSMRCIVPNREIPYLTKIGRNSLWIFIIDAIDWRVLRIIVYLGDGQHCHYRSVYSVLDFGT